VLDARRDGLMDDRIAAMLFDQAVEDPITFDLDGDDLNGTVLSHIAEQSLLCVLHGCWWVLSLGPKFDIAAIQ
jgi:hypothetical protein